MLFNSFSFLVFFPAVTALYFALPHRFRWALLLGASCLFYMAFIPVYILILFFTIAVDYAAGLLIERSQGPRRRFWLGASLAANLGVLAFFKYANFFIENVGNALRAFGWEAALPALSIVLPIGLSFHTFQAMSYTIEIYRGNQKAERHPGIFALYVMFYPQLVAGPIERPGHLLGQFREPHAFDTERVTSGLKLMLWGFFKKVVIADRFAVAVNYVYGNPAAHSGPELALATVFFSFQIFCDFSGYSDIAIGAARVMGFNLVQNFRRPYLAASVAEFWTRWHISLSSWFRDYVYIPLGGNRCARSRWAANLMATFLLSGLWHGAAWNFVLWGALNGLYIIASAATAPLRDGLWRASGLGGFGRLRRIVGILGTFSLVTFTWIFFRARSAHDAFRIVSRLGTGWDRAASWQSLTGLVSMARLGITKTQLLIAAAAIVAMEGIHIFQEMRGSVRAVLSPRPAWVRWPAYYGLLLAVVLLGVFRHAPFIYFQF